MDEKGLERRLEQWGSDQPASVDGAFANRLEADLRRRMVGRRDRSRARPIWQPIALAVAALVVVAGGVFSLVRTDESDEVLVMDAATGTEVILPDGRTVTGANGLALPDLTRIRVGEGGSATVGEVVLDAGDVAVVRDGRLEILPGETAEPRPLTTTTTTADRSTTTTSATTPATTPPATATERPGSTTTVGPATSRVPEPTATDRPVSSDTTERTSPEPSTLLEWSRQRGGVLLSWSYVGPDTVAGWEIVIVAEDRRRPLAVLRDPAARSLLVDDLAGSTSYLVIAREVGGSVIVESNPVTVP